MRTYGTVTGVGGVPEDPFLCVVEIWRNGKGHQCKRRRCAGPNGVYCKQHYQTKYKDYGRVQGERR